MVLTIQIFVGKGLSLLFNMLSRLIYKSSLIYKPRNESFAYFSNSRTRIILCSRFIMICHTGDPGPSECQKQWLRISDGQERPSRRSKQAGERQAIPDPGNNHINNSS